MALIENKYKMQFVSFEFFTDLREATWSEKI